MQNGSVGSIPARLSYSLTQKHHTENTTMAIKSRQVFEARRSDENFQLWKIAVREAASGE